MKHSDSKPKLTIHEWQFCVAVDYWQHRTSRFVMRRKVIPGLLQLHPVPNPELVLRSVGIYA